MPALLGAPVRHVPIPSRCGSSWATACPDRCGGGAGRRADCEYSASTIDLSGRRFLFEDVSTAQGRVLWVRDSGQVTKRGAPRIQEIRYTYLNLNGQWHEASAFTGELMP